MTRQCVKCKSIFPESKEYFWSNGKGGLTARCKKCKNESQSKVRKKFREAEYYKRNRHKISARLMAKKEYDVKTMKCAVLNCKSIAEDLHHVNYEDALAVIPMCRMHHKMDHQVIK